MHTPWGQADSVTHLNGNQVLVSTPSHGGIGVPTETLKALLSPAQWSYVKGLRCSTVGTVMTWLEEDCDALIALVCIPGLFESYVKACCTELSPTEVKAYKATLTLSFGRWHSAWPTDSDVGLSII